MSGVKFPGHTEIFTALTGAKRSCMMLYSDKLTVSMFRKAPRLEVRNFAEYDLTEALRERKIDYWGCPMAGAFRHEPLPIFRERMANIVAWWERCAQTRANGFLLTSWEPQRLAAELPMAVAAAAAGLWIDNERDPKRLWEFGCRRAFGKESRASAARLWASDEKPFCGYPRWQVNDRWDTAFTDEPIEPWSDEARHCARLAPAGGASPGLPPAVSASLRFRAYLAERDLFVRRAGNGVFALRRASAGNDLPGLRRLLAELQGEAEAFARLSPGARLAAREMWRCTRDPGEAGPNEEVLDADRGRLGEWRAWLRRCRAAPDRVWDASPVAGAWQLMFTVTDNAPALQKVAVERAGRDGSWEEASQPLSHRISVPRRNAARQVAVPFLGSRRLGRPSRASAQASHLRPGIRAIQGERSRPCKRGLELFGPRLGAPLGPPRVGRAARRVSRFQLDGESGHLGAAVEDMTPKRLGRPAGPWIPNRGRRRETNRQSRTSSAHYRHARSH